jgi:hypothetical protein
LCRSRLRAIPRALRARRKRRPTKHCFAVAPCGFSSHPKPQTTTPLKRGVFVRGGEGGIVPVSPYGDPVSPSGPRTRRPRTHAFWSTPVGSTSHPRPPTKNAPEGAFVVGGEGGIRTHGGLAPTPDFESGTFDHSATSPAGRSRERSIAQQSGLKSAGPGPADGSMDVPRPCWLRKLARRARKCFLLHAQPWAEPRREPFGVRRPEKGQGVRIASGDHEQRWHSSQADAVVLQLRFLPLDGDAEHLDRRDLERLDGAPHRSFPARNRATVQQAFRKGVNQQGGMTGRDGGVVTRCARKEGVQQLVHIDRPKNLGCRCRHLW